MRKVGVFFCQCCQFRNIAAGYHLSCGCIGKGALHRFQKNVNQVSLLLGKVQDILLGLYIVALYKVRFFKFRFHKRENMNRRPANEQRNNECRKRKGQNILFYEKQIVFAGQAAVKPDFQTV